MPPLPRAPPPAATKRKPLLALINAVVARAGAISVLLLLAGALGFAALPLGQRRVSFDENALLAGSARPTIRFGCCCVCRCVRVGSGGLAAAQHANKKTKKDGVARRV